MYLSSRAMKTRWMFAFMMTLIPLSSLFWMFSGDHSSGISAPSSRLLKHLGMLLEYGFQGHCSVASVPEKLMHQLGSDFVATPAEDRKSSLSSSNDWNSNRTLGSISEIYVVSLPHRMDRRGCMERLRQSLLLEWSYVDAVPSDHPVIAIILDRVRLLRGRLSQDLTDPTATPNDAQSQFSWPPNFDTELDTLSDQRLDFDGSDFWLLPEQDSLHAYATSGPAPASSVISSTSGSTAPRGPYSTSPLSHELAANALIEPEPESQTSTVLQLLTCATRNFTSGRPYVVSLPPYMLLTPAKVACWYSHLNVIRRIAGSLTSSMTQAPAGADGGDKWQAAALVLEDDVDMEWDIRDRLQQVWNQLPADWDMVYLGHCWSNETYHPALQYGTGNTLHPSHAPKCTHAYALTRKGARKLLQHLRHPPFAYSRALDQAFAWLVLSGRIKSYSIVPSIVVQRKASQSDVDGGENGMGSKWRDTLENAVFGT